MIAANIAFFGLGSSVLVHDAHAPYGHVTPRSDTDTSTGPAFKEFFAIDGVFRIANTVAQERIIAGPAGRVIAGVSIAAATAIVAGSIAAAVVVSARWASTRNAAFFAGCAEHGEREEQSDAQQPLHYRSGVNPWSNHDAYQRKKGIEGPRTLKNTRGVASLAGSNAWIENSEPNSSGHAYVFRISLAFDAAYFAKPS